MKIGMVRQCSGMGPNIFQMMRHFELGRRETLYFDRQMNTQQQMPAYDVFISFQRLDERGEPTRDSRLAQEIGEYLESRGIKVCPSSLRSEHLCTADHSEIDASPGGPTVLIAVGTSIDNLNSERVRSEWDGFLNDILSGSNTKGEVVSYLDGLSQNELPLALRQSQSVSNGPGSIERLYNIVADALGITPDAAPVPSVEVLPVGDAKWLLGMRNTIASLNNAMPHQSGLAGSPGFWSWYGMIPVLAVTDWNSGQLTLEAEAAFKQVNSRDGFSNISSVEWEQALFSYTIPSKRGNQLHYLLLTPKEGLFAINYPGFADGWDSDLGRALRTIYPMPESLRSPSEADEIAWCDWLRKYSRE
jgi:hypothetical protein